MRLPEYLETAIQQLSVATDARRVAAASQQLTGRYKRASSGVPVLRSFAERIAYLTARMPATLAANVNVFTELRRRAPEAEISSLFDLGAGPGTALYAATELFPTLRNATLLEADAEWLRTGKQLAARSPFVAVRNAEWLQRDLREAGDLPPHELVVISYVLGELPKLVVESLLRRAWQSAQKFLVVIEPGTKRGSAAINAVRSSLITQGADILAPCPHQNTCPMAAANDWCHFSQRLERTSEHRRMKGGALGYEDEKFSYVAFAKEPWPKAQARIVRHPKIHSGFIQLKLCVDDVLREQTVTRSQKVAFRAARRAKWGDEWRQLE